MAACLLLVSTDPSAEPRMQIDDTPSTQMVFGVDVDGLKPGHAAVVDERAFGYPVRSLADLQAGEYYVQAVLNIYETFHRADGHTVKLPMDRGEGQHWNLAPGNLIQQTGEDHRWVTAAPIAIVLDQEIPPIPEPQGHQIRPPHPNPERTADQILGTPDVLWAHRSCARGIRRATRMRTTRLLSSTAISSTISTAFAPSRPIPI